MHNQKILIVAGFCFASEAFFVVKKKWDHAQSENSDSGWFFCLRSVFLSLKKKWDHAQSENSDSGRFFLPQKRFLSLKKKMGPCTIRKF